MGWDFSHVAPGTKTLDVLKAEFGADRIVSGAVVGSTAYLAVTHEHEGQPVVLGVVVLTQRRRNDFYNFGYKVVDETMGPYEAQCPKRILDLLTDPLNDYAAEWRDRCRENLAAKAKAATVKPGTVIRLDEPLPFNDGRSRQVFRYQGSNKFVADDGVRVAISGWKSRPFTIVTAEAA
jgi:hypothetical protein